LSGNQLMICSDEWTSPQHGAWPREVASRRYV
jgi:hypothetical protein